MRHTTSKKILIVGFGSIGKKYYKLAKKYFIKKNIYIFSKHFNEKKKISYFNNLDNLEYIILSNSSNLRLKYFNLLIKNNRTFLIEKPTFSSAITKKKRSELLKKITDHNLTIKSGYCLRNHPAIIQLKKIVELYRDQIIHINIRTTSYLPFWRTANYKKTVSAKKKLGGGVLNELSHEIDLILYLFNKPKSLFAKFYNSNSLNIETEDVADIIFKMNKNLNLNMHLNFSSFKENRFIEIILKNKMVIEVDLIKNTIKKNNSNKSYKINKLYLIDQQLKKMIKLKKEKNNLSLEEFKDSLEVLNIIRVIRKSNKSKKEEKL